MHDVMDIIPQSERDQTPHWILYCVCGAKLMVALQAIIYQLPRQREKRRKFLHKAVVMSYPI